MSTLKIEHIANIANSGPDISIDTNGHLNIVNGSLQMGGTTMLDTSDTTLKNVSKIAIGGATITDVNLLNIQGDGSTKNVGIVLNKTNSTAQIWSMQVNNTTGGLYFHNYTASNTPVAIRNNGNLGVGINNPNEKMHIYNSSGTTLYKAEVNANSTVGLEIKKTGSTTQSWRIVDGETVNGALQFYDVTDSRVSMQIDGTGALLVGKTAANFATAGTEINASGRTFMTYDGGGPLQLNRKTSFGDIIELHKDGAEVGAIGSPYGNELYIEGTGAITSGLLFTSGNSIQPRKNNAADNGNIDIGTSGNKFKDLYLSGSVTANNVAASCLLYTSDAADE